MVQTLILIVYITGLGFIFVFCLTQLSLAIHQLRSPRRSLEDDSIPFAVDIKELPFVTVQLPIYNEMYVVERLIDAVAQFNYPKDRFEVQVLDDSTDETYELSLKKVEQLRAEGLNIYVVRRPDRTGYKAGALQEGLKTAQGEFVAIFDADFIPKPGFLMKTIPHFRDKGIGLVQTKWQHINKGYSILTKVQAFALDTHFNVEQKGRNAAGFFMNFNGTAGVWRRSCIEDAGGWSFDTLTEDLDLSYRAQLKGWKFKYLSDVGSPAELPALMSAIKSQQYRWSKGPAEVTRKLMKRVLFSKMPLRMKWHGFWHLMNSSVNIFILITAVLSVPLLFMKERFESHWAFSLIYVFFFGLFAISLCYLMAQVVEEKSVMKGLKRFVILFPSFLSLSMGLSLHNSLAALRGHFGVKTAFVRTPKYNISNGQDSFKNKKYLNGKIDGIAISEMFMTVYFFSGIVLAFVCEVYQLLPFHFLLFIGFLSINYFSVKHALLSTAKD